MKRFILLFVLLLLPCFTVSAHAAANGLYLGGKIGIAGVSANDIDWDEGYETDESFTSFGIGPVIGFDFAAIGGPSIRIEGEILFRSGEDWEKNLQGDRLKLDVEYMTTVLANFWWDIASVPAGSIQIKPFIGASAGFGIISYELTLNGSGVYWKESGTESAFLAGPGAGLRFDLSKRLAADAMVRYLFSSDYDIIGEKISAPMLDFNIGLAYKF